MIPICETLAEARRAFSVGNLTVVCVDTESGREQICNSVEEAEAFYLALEN